MVALKEITWEEASAPGFETSTRQAGRAAVAEIAARAKQTLPDCAGRVESAVKIVLAGDVELLADGKAKVASQSNGTTQYFVVNGTCECRDFPRATSGWCKHRIAAGMQKRGTTLMQRTLAQPNGASHSQPEAPTPPTPAEVPTAPLPEAPVSITLKGEHSVNLTLPAVVADDAQRPD